MPDADYNARQKTEFDFLEDVFTHQDPSPDYSNRKQLSIAEQVRQLDQAKIEKDILNSPEFREAAPSLALTYLNENLPLFQNQFNKKGITYDALKNFRDKNRTGNALEKALVDYVLHDGDGIPHKERFDRIRHMHTNDDMGYALFSNAPGITRADIEVGRRYLRDMLEHREKARLDLDTPERKIISRSLDFLETHALELTTKDHPDAITKGALRKYQGNCGSDRSCYEKADVVLNYFDKVESYVRGDNDTITQTQLKFGKTRLRKEDMERRQKFYELEDKWSFWTEK